MIEWRTQLPEHSVVKSTRCCSYTCKRSTTQHERSNSASEQRSNKQGPTPIHCM